MDSLKRRKNTFGKNTKKRVKKHGGEEREDEIPPRFFTTEIINSFVEKYMLNSEYIIKKYYNEIKNEYNTKEKMKNLLNGLCITDRDTNRVGKLHVDHLSNIIKGEVIYNYDIVMIEKNGVVKSVVVTRKGECKRYTNIHTLSLICSNDKKASDIGIKLYVYAVCYKYIVDNDRKIFGLLNLAKGYKNIRGLCLYSKYGFKPDEEFFNQDIEESNSDDEGDMFNDEYPNNDCFPKFIDIPMKFDVKLLHSVYLKQNSQIIDTVEEKINQIVDFIEYLKTLPKDETCYITHRNQNIENEIIDSLQEFYGYLSRVILILKFIKRLKKNDNEYEEILNYIFYNIGEHESKTLHTLADLNKYTFINTFSRKTEFKYDRWINKELYSKIYMLTFLLTYSYLSDEEKKLLLNKMISDIVVLQKQIKKLVVSNEFDETLYKQIGEQFNLLVKL